MIKFNRTVLYVSAWAWHRPAKAAKKEYQLSDNQ